MALNIGVEEIVWVPENYRWKDIGSWPGVEAHNYNPSTWEAEAVRSPVWGHPGLHNETPAQEPRAIDVVQKVLA
jgi:hypothetical protein